jgi:hypothetical protein
VLKISFRRSRFRWSILVLGVAAPSLAFISAGVGLTSSPAGAAAQGLTCTAISGKAQTTVTFSGCKPTAKTGGTATATRLASDNSFTLHWSKGLTTSFSVTYSVPGKKGCSSHELEYLGKGSVTKDTTGATSPGAVAKLIVCINPSTGKAFPLQGKMTLDIAP